MENEIVSLLRSSEKEEIDDRSLLSSISEYFKERFLKDLESKCIMHPLGFIMTSRAVNQNESMRMHVWPPGWTIDLDQKSGRVHDHCYELRSLVLQGGMKHSTYDVSGGETKHFNVFEVRYHDGYSHLHPLGKVTGLTKVSDEEFKVGNLYCLKAGIPHSVCVREHCATIALTSSVANSGAPRVFVPAGVSQPAPFERRILSEEEKHRVYTWLSSI